ncbi:MAG: serpin family protein [Ignavibacteria bacterium]|nr:serpin family protein [Ignavibacteria bacterium]
MKSHILISILCLFMTPHMSCSDRGTEPIPQEMRELTLAEKKLTQSNSKFWLKIFKEMNKEEQRKNIFISPLSISTALGMTLNGAQGTTYDSMVATLEFQNLSLEEINQGSKSLTELLTGVDPGVTMNIANSIWSRLGFAVEEPFINTNKTFFNAQVATLDFSKPSAVETINSWVKTQTKGKIPTILDEPIPEEIVMYLINAIYFKGKWTTQFDPKETRDGEFTLLSGSKVPCKLMTMNTKFRYHQTENYQAIDLPYGAGYFSMSLILPSPGMDIDAFVTGLEPGEWDSIVKGFREIQLHLSLPRFKLEYKNSLKESLTALGMGIAFDKLRADFRGINKRGELFISQADHKAFVEVNEEGTEAAAVTSIGIGIVSLPPTMVVDRPFVFLIRERTSGAILFVGKVVDPRG